MKTHCLWIVTSEHKRGGASLLPSNQKQREGLSEAEQWLVQFGSEWLCSSENETVTSAAVKDDAHYISTNSQNERKDQADFM